LGGNPLHIQMIIPFTNRVNYAGNIIFQFEHLPNTKKEIIERLEMPWVVSLEYDPISEEIIKKICTCPDHNIRQHDCKHIIESSSLLSLFLKSDGTTRY